MNIIMQINYFVNVWYVRVFCKRKLKQIVSVLIERGVIQIAKYR